MAEPSLFDSPRADLIAEPIVVDASHLGELRSIVATSDGVKLRCDRGMLILSPEQFFAFVRFRKAGTTLEDVGRKEASRA